MKHKIITKVITFEHEIDPIVLEIQYFTKNITVNLEVVLVQRGIYKVSMHMHVADISARYQGNACSSCWIISVWTMVMDCQCHPWRHDTNMTYSNQNNNTECFTLRNATAFFDYVKVTAFQVKYLHFYWFSMKKVHVCNSWSCHSEYNTNLMRHSESIKGSCRANTKINNYLLVFVLLWARIVYLFFHTS